MAQNITCIPWEGTRGPWLCLMTKLLLFGLLWLFYFISAFSHFSDLTYSLASFSTDKKQAEGMGVKDHRVLLHFIGSQTGDLNMLVAQLCPTLCDPMDCSTPGSSVHGILQARIDWSGLPFPSPGDLLDLGIEPRSPALRADSLPSEA